MHGYSISTIDSCSVQHVHGINYLPNDRELPYYCNGSLVPRPSKEMKLYKWYSLIAEYACSISLVKYAA